MSEVWWKEVATSEIGGRLQYRYELSYDKDGHSTLLPDNQQDSKHVSYKFVKIYILLILN